MTRITMRDAIREAMREEMLRDERVFLLGQDIAQYGGAFKVTKGLWEEFGLERVINTPISEAAMVFFVSTMRWRRKKDILIYTKRCIPFKVGWH